MITGYFFKGVLVQKISLIAHLLWAVATVLDNVCNIAISTSKCPEEERLSGPKKIRFPLHSVVTIL